MPKRFFLTKSRLTAYHQCKRRLWLEVHRRDLLKESVAIQRKFAIGPEVGELARAQYPNGVLIGYHGASHRALSETTETLAARPKRPVFEAAALHDDVLVRADLLLPVRGGFHMAEVKSSTKVKPYHLNDVAVQTWVMRKSGLPLKSVEVRHINSQYVYPGNNDYRGIFTSGDVGADVEKLQSEVPRWISDARAALERSEPDVATGKHCDDPFECPFKEHCSSLEDPGPDYPVSLLPGAKGAKVAAKLAGLGLSDLCKVPPSRITGDERLRRIHTATRSGKPYLSRAARKLVNAWPYPRYYLDFETINFAVPRWAGTRPYQQIPFQWSCHIENKNGQLDHKEFLDVSGDDPMRSCAESLVASLGAEGPIIAYAAGFERGVVERLANQFHDLRKPLTSIANRIVDLLPVVRDHYYHRDMKGSYSIKAVLPTIAPELVYSSLGEVQDGGGAQDAYLEAIHPQTSSDRRRTLRQDLLDYCERDTLAMIRVAKALSHRALHVRQHQRKGVGLDGNQ